MSILTNSQKTCKVKWFFCEFIICLAAFIILLPSLSHAELRGPKVKGFQLGMSKEEAVEALKNIDPNITVAKKVDGSDNRDFFSNQYANIRFIYDWKSVNELTIFELDMRLFNAALSLEFIDDFFKHYNLNRQDFEMPMNNQYIFLNHRDGYGIRMNQYSIGFQIIPKKSEAKFD